MFFFHGEGNCTQEDSPFYTVITEAWRTSLHWRMDTTLSTPLEKSTKPANFWDSKDLTPFRELVYNVTSLLLKKTVNKLWYWFKGFAKKESAEKERNC